MQVKNMLFGEVTEVEAAHGRRYLVDIGRKKEREACGGAGG